MNKVFATILLILSSCVSLLAQRTGNDYVVLAPRSVCWMTPLTTAFTAGPELLRAASGNAVLSGTTNTTLGSVIVTCEIPVQGRVTLPRIREIQLLYGIQTTGLTSIGAATVTTVTYVAPGGTAQGTVAAAGGAITVLPASLQLTTTTSGQCFTESLIFATPIQVADRQKITIDQSFNTAGTTATTLQICGVVVHFTSGQ